MKKILSVLLAVLMLFSMAACGSQPAAQEATETAEAATPAAEEPAASSAGGIYTPGSYAGKAQGFGGEVTLSLTVDETAITACEVIGDGETEGIGGVAIEKLQEEILAKNGENIDAISGATVTSEAVKTALAQALGQARGEDVVESVSMTPGTYRGEGFGYSIISPVIVDVTVSENAIESIEIVEAERETGPIFLSAVETMIPRIIENQSISVDAITGATAASNGIRTAVTQALTEAVGGDAAKLAPFQTVPEKKTDSDTIDVNVLVVGMGGSGCAAAMSAAEAMHAVDPANVSVLAIDKSAKFGGTSANCAEPMAVNAPRYKEAYNNGEDYMDKELMRANWLEYVDGGAKEEMLDLFLDNSGETVDWLHFDHGFVFNNPTTGFAETDIYRCKYQYTYLMNAEEGRDYGIELKFRNEQVDEYFHNLMDDFQELGGKYMLETEAYELLYDETGNAIKGVKARRYDGTEYTINANAVILATGGFAGNGEMEETYFENTYYPIKGAWGTYGWGMSQNDGKMIQSAIDIGAGTYNIDMPPMVHFATTKGYITDYPVQELDPATNFSMLYNWYGQIPTWSLNDVPMAMALSGNVLQVDVQGKRYADENELFVWWEAGPEFYAIWSEAQVQEVIEKGFTNPASAVAQGQGGVPGDTPIPEMHEIIDKAIEKGYVYKADTLKELAALTGMDATTLQASVSKYNEACAAGADDEFGKDPSLLWALGEEGPYYAIASASVVYSTCGGLDVDTEIRVLQADGVTPIGGLYAVGNDSGGVLYTNTKPYVTYGGAALGWAFTSGRLAGQNAVNYTGTLN